MRSSETGISLSSFHKASIFPETLSIFSLLKIGDDTAPGLDTIKPQMMDPEV